MKKFNKIIFLLLMILSLGILCSCGKGETEDSPSVKEEHVHNFKETQIINYPTCESEGLEIRECECGEKEESSIPPTGHTFGEWILFEEPTCKDAGLEVRECMCGEKEERSVAVIEHTYGEWTVAKDSTCTEVGLELRYCTCGATQTREIEPSHKVELTLSEDGTYYIVTDKGCDHGVIPTQYNGIPVTTIGKNAFNRSTLTDIAIPEGITTIGEGAFYNSALVNISFPSTLTTIEGEAFSYNRKLENVVLPQNLTTIKRYAFSNCASLSSITFQNRISTIEENAFYNCRGLTKVEINDLKSWVSIDFENIDSNPLSYAKHLYLNNEEIKQLVISEDITSIKKYSFYNCLGLNSVIIPSTLLSIGEDAFYNCSNIYDVLATSISSWCEIDFSNGDSNPLNYATNLYIDGNIVTNMIIPEEVTNIGKYAFYNYTKFTSITIPSTLLSIGEDAFYNCSGINFVYISDLESWCNIDFANANASPLFAAKGVSFYLNDQYIKELVIPDTVINISDYAFYYCYNIKTLTIPGTVNNIGAFAFSGCSSIESINLEEGISSIGEEAFFNCDALKIITIPDSVKTIGSQAFYCCDNLYYVTIPFVGENVDGTGNVKFSHAFDKTYNITTVKVTGGTIIGKDAFSSWYDLEKIYLPDTITTIGDYAFAFTNITSITIPDEAISIGKNILYSCDELYSITLSTKNVKSFGYLFGASSYNYNDTYVPASLKSVTLYDSTVIPDRFFYDCINITSVNLQSSLVTIGSYAFYNCNKITRIEIPYNVNEIGIYAFSLCNSLTYARFGYSDGWYCSETKGANSGSMPVLMDTSKIATYLKSTYSNCYWYNFYI